jgi:hypothetical protein
VTLLFALKKVNCLAPPNVIKSSDFEWCRTVHIYMTAESIICWTPRLAVTFHTNKKLKLIAGGRVIDNSAQYIAMDDIESMIHRYTQ